MLYLLNVTKHLICFLTPHNCQHHSVAQTEAVWEQQALGHNLVCSDAVCILGKQFPVRICHGGKQFFPTAADQLKQFLVLFSGQNIIFRWFDIAISEFFQNIHNITLPKCGCDVNSAAWELQVANLPKYNGLYLVYILSER